MQHVGRLRGDSRHVHDGRRTQARVRVLPEFDFLPEDHDEYEEEDEDEGENADADELSWSDVTQRFCLRCRERKLKRGTWMPTSTRVTPTKILEFSFAAVNNHKCSPLNRASIDRVQDLMGFCYSFRGGNSKKEKKRNKEADAPQLSKHLLSLWCRYKEI